MKTFAVRFSIDDDAYSDSDSDGVQDLDAVWTTWCDASSDDVEHVGLWEDSSCEITDLVRGTYDAVRDAASLAARAHPGITSAVSEHP